ncbi:hypothetical protein [Solibaculum mannosilyticum]|uniref:hypothetical protein n=1 Tax=Solibaculum mannosilyticum TaxID=2780922 RepID=UPI0007A8C2AC|nr:hypothetical protein [Solibaculum mannosilyticum]CZT56191.1 hypothetical protein BN3661_01245 [Eubacteriaceae bacterium CHKCI005]
MGSFLDLFNGKIGFSASDNLTMDEDGNLVMKMSNNMAMDMNTGDLHILSSSGSIFDEDDNDW